MWKLFTEPGTALVVEPTLDRPPVIYLDLAPVMRIAKSPELRERFKELFKRGGILVFSWALALDVSGPQGDDATTLESFLSDLGPHWLPAEMNLFRVARREAGQESCDGHPCISASLVIGYVTQRLYELSPGGSKVVGVDDSLFDLGRIVAWTQKDRDEVQQQMKRYKDEMDGYVQQLRAEVAKETSASKKAKVLDTLLPSLALDGAQPATALFHALLRLIVLRPENETWDSNDAFDLSHAAIGGAVADLIALDKTWKRRLLQTGIEKGKPEIRVYRPNEELILLLDEFERRLP